MNAPAVEDLSNYNPVEDPAFMQLLKDWEKAQRAAAKAVDEERKLRDEVAKCAFVNPKEGVNKLKLLHGYQLEMDYKVNRTIDRAVLQQYSDTLEGMGVDLGQLIREKPELRVGEYKKIAPEVRNVFDLCLTIKPGTPSLKINLPKRG